MRRHWLWVGLALAFAGLGCTGVGVGVYGRPYPGYYYGRGPFWGYGDRVVVVDPCSGGRCDGGIDGLPPGEIDPPEAVPLPEPPPDFPDMDVGMPDMGVMDMDVGGFDY